MFSETDCSGAGTPLKVTETSAMLTESGTLSDRTRLVAKPVPKIATMEPGATPAPRSKLAALATPPSETTGVCACAAKAQQRTKVQEQNSFNGNPSNWMVRE